MTSVFKKKHLVAYQGVLFKIFIEKNNHKICAKAARVEQRQTHVFLVSALGHVGLFRAIQDENNPYGS